MTIGRPPTVYVIGQRFGRLEVIGDGDGVMLPTGRVQRRVRVRCDCGNEKDVQMSALRAGSTKSCGCGKSGEDVTGRRYGRLVIGARVLASPRGRYFEVTCDCGTKRVASLDHMKSGKTKSCGCWGREVARSQMRERQFNIRGVMDRVKRLERIVVERL